MEAQGLEARPPRFATYPGLDIRASVARNRNPGCIATVAKFCKDIVCSCCEGLRMLMFKYLALHPRICLCCQSSSPDTLRNDDESQINPSNGHSSSCGSVSNIKSGQESGCRQETAKVVKSRTHLEYQLPRNPSSTICICISDNKASAGRTSVLETCHISQAEFDCSVRNRLDNLNHGKGRVVESMWTYHTRPGAERHSIALIY